MCTSPSEVTHVCLLDLDSTASRSRHGSLLCLDPQAQAICVSPYQICAHQAFACRNRPRKRAPRPPARKTQKSGQPKAIHALPRAAVSLEKSTTRRLRFLTSRSSSWYTCRPDGLVVHRSTWPENLVVIRRHTRLHAPPGFLASPSCVGGLSTHLPRAETLLLTSSDDVITPRQQPCKHVHVSKSHVSPRHVIRHFNSVPCQHHVTSLIVDPDRPDLDYTDLTR